MGHCDPHKAPAMQSLGIFFDVNLFKLFNQQ